jgi:hypothetical protein
VEDEIRDVWFGGESVTQKKKKKEKITIEEAAEETGKLVGKGIKKGFGIVKAFAKGADEAITEKKKEKKQ